MLRMGDPEMSDPIAVMERMFDAQFGREPVSGDDFAQARADLLELIEADREYDAAHAEINKSYPPGSVLVGDSPLLRRLMAAEQRRSSAIAKFPELQR